jgi:hypothetical protein
MVARRRERLGEGGEVRPSDDVPAPCIRRRGQPAGVDPPSDGVVAHPEQVGRLANSERRHVRIIAAPAAAQPA